MSDFTEGERRLLYDRLGEIHEEVRATNLYIREQNGRIGQAESRLAVLEDRSGPARVAAGVSTLISALIAGLASLWK